MYSHRDSKMQVPEIPKIPGMPSWLGGTFCLCVGGWWAVMRSRTESCSGGRGAMRKIPHLGKLDVVCAYGC